MDPVSERGDFFDLFTDAEREDGFVLVALEDGFLADLDFLGPVRPKIAVDGASHSEYSAGMGGKGMSLYSGTFQIFNYSKIGTTIGTLLGIIRRHFFPVHLISIMDDGFREHIV